MRKAVPQSRQSSARTNIHGSIAQKIVLVSHVDPRKGVPPIKYTESRVGLYTHPQRHSDLMTAREMAPQPVTEHAVTAENQYAQSRTTIKAVICAHDHSRFDRLLRSFTARHQFSPTCPLGATSHNQRRRRNGHDKQISPSANSKFAHTARYIETQSNPN